MFSKTTEPDQEHGLIDSSKRYDIYCLEHGIRVAVLKNVKIIGQKMLFQHPKEFQVVGKFIELEQMDGSHVFISQTSVIRLCEHGVQIDIQNSN